MLTRMEGAWSRGIGIRGEMESVSEYGRSESVMVGVVTVVLELKFIEGKNEIDEDTFQCITHNHLSSFLSFRTLFRLELDSYLWFYKSM